MANENTNPVTDVSAQQSASESVTIERPEAAQSEEVTLQPGQSYVFDFAESDAESIIEEDSTLTFNFPDGGKLTVNNFVQGLPGLLSPSLAFSDGVVIDMNTPEDDILGEVQDVEEEPQAEMREERPEVAEQVAAVEPEAGNTVSQPAESLAQIEPAAGEDAASTENTGFTFDNPTITPIGALAAVGPIDPTLLRYGVEFPVPEVFGFEEGEQGTVNGLPEIDAIRALLDESDLGPLVQNGQIPFDFGPDAPGSVGPEGSFNVSGSLLGGIFTSGGETITVNPVVDGYEGVLPGGETVFTVTINPVTGAYTYTQVAPFDHADGTDPNDTISMEFGIQVEDGNGDVAISTLTIVVADDAPGFAEPDENTVHEDTLIGGPIVVTDSLVIDFGNDLDGSVTPEGTSSVTGVGSLTSGGQPITIVPTATGYIGTLPGDVTAFTLEIDPTTGAYTYTQNVGFDHNPENDTISLEFGVDVTDFDGDATQTTITINVNDSRPEIGGEEPEIGRGYESIDETNIPGGTSVSGSLDAAFGGDGPGALLPAGTYEASGSLLGGALSAGGQAITVTPTTNGYVGTINGGVDTVFTLDIDPASGDYTFAQLIAIDHADGSNPNDVITLRFDVEISDADGDTDSGSIVIDIADDAPSISGDGTKSIDEDGLEGGPQSVTGDLAESFGNDGAGEIAPNGTSSFAGVPSLTSGGQPITVSATANGYEGTLPGDVTAFTLEINPATGAYEFTLNAPLDHADGSDLLTLTFGTQIEDFDGDTAEANIVIEVEDDKPRINDDEPEIGNGLEVVDESDLPGGTTVSGSLSVNGGADTPVTLAPNGTNGSSVPLTSGGQPVTVAQTTTGYEGTINGGSDTIFTLIVDADGDYTFTLVDVLDHPDATDPDDVIELTFGVSATDADGDSDDGQIIIRVNDDGPVANDDFASVEEGSNVITGNVTGNDDVGEDIDGSVINVRFNGTDYPVVSGVATVIDGDYGTLEINADGSYTYTSDANVAGNVIDAFIYTLQDFDGDTDTARLKITVTDQNDNPILAETVALEVDETDLIDTDSNTVSADFGDDGPGTYEATGAATFGFSGAKDGALTSGGVPVTVSVVGNDYVGTAAGNTVFTLTLDENTGAYEFTLTGVLDHADVTDPDDVIALTFGVTARDVDGDTDTGTITVNVRDDGPFIEQKARPIDEDGLVDGPITYTHTLNHGYGEDGAGEIRPTGTFEAKYQVGGQNQTLTSMGHDVLVSATANGYEGVANGQTVFTLSVQNNGQYTYTQFQAIDHPDGNNPDDVIWLKFQVEIVDFDGDTDQAFIIVDLHDGAPVAEDDHVTSKFEDGIVTGDVTDNDSSGPDVPASVTEVRIGGQSYDVPANGDDVVINGQFGALTINNTGAYSYDLFDTAFVNGAEFVRDIFEYTLTDFDGDSDVAKLKIKTFAPEAEDLLIVGQNVDDVDGQVVPWEVGDGEEVIVGDAANDILIGDVGGSRLEKGTQDYNFVFVLDTSGSMGKNGDETARLTKLVAAVKNLMTQFDSYVASGNGDVVVRIVDFSTNVKQEITIDFSQANALNTAIAHLDGLNGQGLTNYESPLAAAVNWLQNGGEMIDDAVTTTYFISDGEPNRYDNNGDITSGEDAVILAEINGSDGSNEVADLQAFGEVVSVGISVGQVALDNLNAIDTDGSATNIVNPNDLQVVLDAANPLNRLSEVGDDELVGEAGRDIIFGDSVFTDILADAQGLDSIDGAGWDVFTRLENGEGLSAAWDRADTVAYIRNNVRELAQESLDSDGQNREGGNDTIYAGAGNDIIVGQEGADVIYGESGADTFLYVAVNDDVDTIKDFDVSEGDVIDISGLLQGYDAVQDSINDFVYTTEVNGNTIVSVDANGTTGGVNTTDIAILEGVTGLDIELATNNGEAKV